MILELANQPFALLVFVVLTSIQLLAAATHDEDIWLVVASGIDHSIFDPCSLSTRSRVGICRVNYCWIRTRANQASRAQFGRSNSSHHCPHKISAIHCPVILSLRWIEMIKLGNVLALPIVLEILVFIQHSVG